MIPLYDILEKINYRDNKQISGLGWGEVEQVRWGVF